MYRNVGVYSNAVPHSMGAAAALSLSSPMLRQPLAGSEGYAKGEGLNAIITQNPVVVFYFRSSSSISQFQCEVTVKDYSFSGGDSNASARGTYPYLTRNVTTLFSSNQGRVEVDMRKYLIAEVVFTITNLGSSTATGYSKIEVFGEHLPKAYRIKLGEQLFYPPGESDL